MEPTSDDPQCRCPRQILVYRIPDGITIGSDGYTPGRRLDIIPAGDYIEHKQLGFRGDQICLVPLGYPASVFTSPHYWVREHDVANYAVPFVPQDHELPEPGKCFLGLNFEPQDFAAIQDALLTAAAKTVGNGCVEHDLASICRYYNAAHAGPVKLVSDASLDTSEQDAA